jgi:hypothetical protein
MIFWSVANAFSSVSMRNDSVAFADFCSEDSVRD